MKLDELELLLVVKAKAVAAAEKALAEEYLLHIAAGQHTWAAQKMAEVRYSEALRHTQAEYEIVLARLRRS